MKADLKRLLGMVLFSCWIMTSSAQNSSSPDLRFRGGAVLGLNASQVDGDDYAGYHKLGITGGFTAQVPFSKKFFMSMEILYSQKGAKSRTYSGFPTEYRLNLSYVEVPVLINFQEKSAVNFGLGASYGRLVKTKEFVDELEQPVSDDFKRDDICGLVSASYLFSRHFHLNIRFAYSLFPMGHRATSNFNNRGMYNNVLSFRLAYIL